MFHLHSLSKLGTSLLTTCRATQKPGVCCLAHVCAIEYASMMHIFQFVQKVMELAQEKLSPKLMTMKNDLLNDKRKEKESFTCLCFHSLFYFFNHRTLVCTWFHIYSKFSSFFLFLVTLWAWRSQTWLAEHSLYCFLTLTWFFLHWIWLSQYCFCEVLLKKIPISMHLLPFNALAFEWKQELLY